MRRKPLSFIMNPLLAIEPPKKRLPPKRVDEPPWRDFYQNGLPFPLNRSPNRVLMQKPERLRYALRLIRITIINEKCLHPHTAADVFFLFFNTNKQYIKSGF